MSDMDEMHENLKHRDKLLAEHKADQITPLKLDILRLRAEVTWLNNKLGEMQALKEDKVMLKKENKQLQETLGALKGALAALCKL